MGYKSAQVEAAYLTGERDTPELTAGELVINAVQDAGEAARKTWRVAVAVARTVGLNLRQEQGDAVAPAEAAELE